MIYYEDYIKFENGIYETFNSSKEFDSPTIKMYSCRKNSAIISALKSCIILNITNSKFTDSSFNQMEISVSKDKTTVNITIQEKIIDKLINYMPFCTNVQCLWINQNTQTLDPFLNLPSLKYLFIYRCSVNYKINDILKIKSLKILSIERTDLLYIPEEISNLKELEVLSLMHNSIQTLPKEIEKLLNLKYLGLNGTSITQIPNTLEKLIHLQYLYLGKTKITELPIELSHLKELLRLALWETELKELPEWICSFSKLKGLYLGRSKNIQFLPQNLGDLVNLEELYLDGTGITELPESFSNLINLRNLQLNDTKIQKIPRLNPMKHLISCNLSNMVIEKIPKEFITAKMNIYTNTNSHIGTRNGLFLYNTKLLCQPISLFSHEKEFIYAYYKESKVHLNESKIVFLGDGESGKSHIIRRIQNNGQLVEAIKYQATPGIDIVPKQCEIDNEYMNLQLWDFGGQDILHSMHRFFLTDRTLYVIVVNARDNTQNERARYWLNNVKSFANGCPVILVLNKIDQNPSAGFNETLLKNDYPQIKNILKMSALEDTSVQFNYLTEKIFETIKTFDSYAMEFPISWNKIKLALTNMDENYIVDENYRLLCKKNNVDDPNIQNWLLEWFHDLGVSFNYRKKDILLGGYMVLKPQWITNAIYIILFNAKELAKNGVISKENIVALLENPPKSVEDITYNISEIPYIIGVLRRFDISYEIDDNHEFLPMLCEENEPDSVQSFISNDCLEYFMEYEYLPNNVLHKLMIRMRNNLQKDKIWLTGMFLSEHEEGVSAIIRMHEKKLEIFIKSENADLISPKEYLREIRGHLSNINKELGLNAQDTLVYKEDNLREEIPYDTLLILLNERQTTYFSTTFRKKLSVKALLGIVEARVDYLQYLAENSHELSEKDLREIMLRLPQVSYFDLEQELISCCIDLQGQNLLKKQGSENDLNTYIKGLLTHCQKYIVHDQTLNGISAGGISPGELDLKICVKKNTREEPLAIVEALKLDSVNKTYIKNHIDKIYGYDTWGSKYNYLLVYAYTKNFELFCSKYKSFMQTNDFPLQVQNHLTERRLNNISEIRIFNTILIGNGRETTLTHIIVNME